MLNRWYFYFHHGLRKIGNETPFRSINELEKSANSHCLDNLFWDAETLYELGDKLAFVKLKEEILEMMNWKVDQEK